MTSTPMRGHGVIALAGRRVDAEHAEHPRFPLANAERVRARLRTLFVERGTSVLVCAAACGVDLLALEAAGELGLRRRIVLPFEAGRFRRVSVEDRPGDWGERFDRVLREVGEREVRVLAQEGPHHSAFRAANALILEEAQALVDEAPRETELLAVAVWEGLPRGANDFTASFIQLARARSLEVVEVSTLAA